MDTDTRLFFLHLPKAAGTTFKEVLYRQYPFRQIAWIDGSYHEESVQRLINLPAAQRNLYNCVMGHFQYGLHAHFDGAYQYVTFLRDPVARTVSTYYHILNKSPHHNHHKALKQGEVSLEAFVKQRISDETSNLQVRWISGEPVANEASLARAKENIERDFIFAGISEEFDRSVVMYALAADCEKPLHYARKNEGVYKQEPLKQRVRELIAEENALDIELYSWVKDRLAASIAAAQPILNERLEALTIANKVRDQNRERFSLFYHYYEGLLWKLRHKRNPLLVRRS